MKKLRAYVRLLRQKMLRDRLSPKRVAGGWALGMFVGCFIPFGLQLIVSIPLSFLMKVSKIGATVGTFVTNPVTIIFIYPVQTWVGSYLIASPLGWNEITGYCHRLAGVSVFSADGWRTLSEIGGAVLGGFFAGGLLMALVLTPLTYFAVLDITRRHRERISRRG